MRHREIDYNKLALQADKECEICDGAGFVTEGEYDDIHDAPCPCTIEEEADFTGATEGDR